MQNFKKVMNKYGIKNEKLLNRLFERFKLEKSSEKSEREEIDLQDFVIGLGKHDRANREDLLQGKLIGEGGQVPRSPLSYSLLFDLAHKKANRNYNELMVLLKRNNKKLKNDEGDLITSDEFLQALQHSRDLFREEKFVPLNLSLTEIIVHHPPNRTMLPANPILKSRKMSRKLSWSFGRNLEASCSRPRMKRTAIPSSTQVTHPLSGRVDIIKNDKIVETLPNV
jgi:hypothetical protein